MRTTTMTIYKVWMSDCLQYYAVPQPTLDETAYDVLEADGDRVWLARRYRLRREDRDPRYTHAEFPRLVGSWVSKGKWDRGLTRWREAFALWFVDIRQDLQVLPVSARRDDLPWDAHILARYCASFSRQRRVAKATWEHLQARIAVAIVEGHRALYRSVAGRVTPAAAGMVCDVCGLVADPAWSLTPRGAEVVCPDCLVADRRYNPETGCVTEQRGQVVVDMTHTFRKDPPSRTEI